MKDLKFRAWHKMHKKYYEVTGMGLGEEFRHALLLYDIKESEERYMMSEEDDIVIEQYIGRKDMNGREIYAGDILGAKHKWIEQSFIGKCVLSIEYGILIYDGHGEEHYYVPQNFRYRVLGNVHENKELLKGE